MALTDTEMKELEAKVKAVHDKNSGIQSREDRRNNILYGVLALFYLVLIVVGAVAGAWSSVLSTLGLALWLAFVWMQSRMITFQRFVINTQRDLRDLEHAELEAAMQQEPKAPVKKSKAKAAKGTA